MKHEIKVFVGDCEIDAIAFEGTLQEAFDEAFEQVEYLSGEGYKQVRARVDNEGEVW